MNASTNARRRGSRWLAGCLCLLLGAQAAMAQDPWCGPNCDFNEELFAPIDFDYDCQPLRKDCGFFFNYSRLAWAFTGEKTTIGNPGQTVQSEVIFPGTPFSEGTPPPTFTIQNGIQEALPNGDFGYGHRYEFGHFRGGAGWMIGIMDGPRVNSNEYYGFNQIEIPNQLPLIVNQNDLNFNEELPPTLVLPSGAGSADLSTARTGFGSVHVNFITPAGYLLGFRDYHINGPNNEQGPTIGGPSRQLLITEVEPVEIGDLVVFLEITDATVVTGGDGITDDLDGDTLPGFFFVRADTNGDGEITDDDDVIGTGVDFDDLHLFNVVFDNLRVRNVTESHSVEIMRTHQLDNNWMFKSRQNNRLHIGYGVRFFNLDDTFQWEGKGGLLGRTVVHTVAENQIIGPQIRAMWSHQHGRWGLDMDGRFLFGYNVQDINQDSNMGEDLAPGALNRPIAATPTTTSIGRQDNNFSPLVEMRAQGSYQLTSAIALKLGYTATFIDNITRGSQVVVYRLPEMGLRRGGNQEIFVSGVDVGIEAVY